MRDYKRVSPRFWPEAQAGGWTDDMKMLALYLLTCEHRTTEGLYRLPVEYMAADLSGADGLGCDLAGAWSPERVRAALARLSADGFVSYDHAARVVFLPRALAYQAPENPNQRKAAIKSLRGLPRRRSSRPSSRRRGATARSSRRSCANSWRNRRRERMAESPAPAPAPLQLQLQKNLWPPLPRRPCLLPKKQKEQTADSPTTGRPTPARSASPRRGSAGRLSDANRIAAVAAAGHVAEYAAGAGVDLLYVPLPRHLHRPQAHLRGLGVGPAGGLRSRRAPNADAARILCLACQAGGHARRLPRRHLHREPRLGPRGLPPRRRTT